jgi:hypothetical protein
MSEGNGELTQEQCEAELREPRSDDEYWKTLKDFWIGFGRSGRNVQFWLDAFRKPRGGREQNLMDANERAALANLPNPVVLYRGVLDGKHALGMSWTDDLNQAARFAYPHGVVVKAVVPKQLVLAYFLVQHENEVVIDPTTIEFETYLMSAEELERRASRAKRQGSEKASREVLEGKKRG